MSTSNAVELSPLTVDACVRRITSDRHPGRTDAALCQLAVIVGAVADRRAGFDRGSIEMALRGLAVQADPDGYTDQVRQLLGAAVDAL